MLEDKKKAYLYLIITTCAWGSLYVFSKFILGKVPPFTISFLRYLIAGPTLLLISRKSKLEKIERKDYKYIFFIGFIGYSISVGAQLLGTKLSNASIASLVNSMNPIFIILFAVFILKEKLTVKKVISVAAAVGGTCVIIGGVSGNVQITGIFISIFAVITWSLMSVAVRRITQKYNPLTVTTYGILTALIFTFPISIYEYAATPNVILMDWTVILSILYMGLVCTALAHMLWNKSLSMIEAGTCSLFYPLQPLTSALLGWLLLGENISIRFIFGAILIIGGVLFSIIGGKEKAEKINNIENMDLITDELE